MRSGDALSCILFDFDGTLVECPGHNLGRAALRQVDPETPTVLAALGERGVKLGIVSSAPRRDVVPVLREAGLLHHFQPCLVTAEECPRRKPHPYPLLRALHVLEVDPCRAVYVGDSPDDAAAAHACGMRFALAGWSQAAGPRETIPYDWILAGIRDLLALDFSRKGARDTPSHLEEGSGERPQTVW